jgi:hypothetical protein
MLWGYHYENPFAIGYLQDPDYYMGLVRTEGWRQYRMIMRERRRVEALERLERIREQEWFLHDFLTHGYEMATNFTPLMHGSFRGN